MAGWVRVRLPLGTPGTWIKEKEWVHELQDLCKVVLDFGSQKVFLGFWDAARRFQIGRIDRLLY